jgi:hypothetical protein
LKASTIDVLAFFLLTQVLIEILTLIENKVQTATAQISAK